MLSLICRLTISILIFQGYSYATTYEDVSAVTYVDTTFIGENDIGHSTTSPNGRYLLVSMGHKLLMLERNDQELRQLTLMSAHPEYNLEDEIFAEVSLLKFISREIFVVFIKNKLVFYKWEQSSSNISVLKSYVIRQPFPELDDRYFRSKPTQAVANNVGNKVLVSGASESYLFDISEAQDITLKTVFDSRVSSNMSWSINDRHIIGVSYDSFEIFKVEGNEVSHFNSISIDELDEQLIRSSIFCSDYKTVALLSNSSQEAKLHLLKLKDNSYEYLDSASLSEGYNRKFSNTILANSDCSSIIAYDSEALINYKVEVFEVSELKLTVSNVLNGRRATTPRYDVIDLVNNEFWFLNVGQVYSLKANTKESDIVKALSIVPIDKEKNTIWSRVTTSPDNATIIKIGRQLKVGSHTDQAGFVSEPSHYWQPALDIMFNHKGDKVYTLSMHGITSFSFNRQTRELEKLKFYPEVGGQYFTISKDDSLMAVSNVNSTILVALSDDGDLSAISGFATYSAAKEYYLLDNNELMINTHASFDQPGVFILFRLLDDGVEVLSITGTEGPNNIFNDIKGSDLTADESVFMVSWGDHIALYNVNKEQDDIVLKDQIFSVGNIQSLSLGPVKFSSDGNYIFAINNRNTLLVFDSHTYELINNITLDIGSEKIFYLESDSESNVLFASSLNYNAEISFRHNTPPNIGGLPLVLSILEKESIDLNQYIYDYDGDDLQVTYTPHMAGIDIINGHLEVNPSVELDNILPFNFQIKATDGMSTVEQTIEMNSSWNNSRPVKSETIEPYVIEPNELFSLDLNDFYDDLDNDYLHFSAVGMPEGFIVTSKGVFQGVSSSEGEYTITLNVTDGREKIQQSFSLSIDDPSNNDEENDGNTDESEQGYNGEEHSGVFFMIILLLFGIYSFRKNASYT